MSKIFKIFSPFPVILITVCLFILSKSYLPGTFLSGWDTLHPEFNFPLSVERLVNGVFRSEQGLGAVAAHSHMSDLPRVIILWILSFALPTEFLRFFYIGACLITGVLGIYSFLKNIVLEKSHHKEFFAFGGALFYLLNLGTLQHFYVIFEMFAVQFAFLPWIFLTMVNYINQPSRKNLLAFTAFNILATPMAFAPMLWYAYFLCLLLFLLSYAKKHLRKVLIIIGITFLVNSFWLLPNLYFIASGNASNVPEARINKIFSEEAFTFNKSYGNIIDTLIFKNFLFDWAVYLGNDKFDLLLKDWNKHLSNRFVLAIGYFFAFISLLGVMANLKKGTKAVKALLLPLFASLIFILNLSFPFDIIMSILRDNISLFREALRFPFTKFSLIAIFGFSCFFALGLEFLSRRFHELTRIPGRLIVIFQTIIIASLLIIFALPAFKGDFISKHIQVRIPSEYFQLFNWLNSQPQEKRIAVLPMHSFWGVGLL